MDSPTLHETTTRIIARDGAGSDLQLVSCASGSIEECVVWLPAMGVAARNYLPLARALASRGIALALHEWRGIGSSDRRAGRTTDWAYRDLLRSDIPASVAAARAAFPNARCWIGGHSLGGQLASLYSALHPDEFAGLILVAAGSPYWRLFRHAWLIGALFAAGPVLAKACGYFPGRRVGFGGNESRGVIADWARSGRSGRYAPADIEQDLESLLSALRTPIIALTLRDDWLAPEKSLRGLLDKMPHAPRLTQALTSDDLAGAAADHFSWMKTPDVVAQRLAAWIVESGGE
jgi:predicted alpha/beta hydrolase